MKSKSTSSILALILSMALCLAGGTAIATADPSIYKIQSKIFIGGKLVSNPETITSANQKTSVALGRRDLKIEFIIEELAEDNIGIKYDIQYLERGRMRHGEFKIIVRPNQEGIIQLEEDSYSAYEIRVIAEKS